MPELISTCEVAARGAGKVLLEFLGRYSVRKKGPGDLVTDADLAAEQLIRQIVARDFPDHGFIGEESSNAVTPDCEFVWYVDPLDGTMNYVRGLGHFAVSIAVAQRGELVAGVIYDPLTDECYTATAGGGSQLNGHPIKTSNTTALADAMVAVGMPVHAQRGQPAVEEFLNVLARCQGVRRMGSSALNLCYVADGRFDAYWDTKTSAWDVAAGVLIVREAGGIVSGPEGGPFRLDRPHPVASANAGLHLELFEALGRRRD
ncbi:MAG: inositol monophosphatase [Planctomycetia bacterium]|nr:inositol monophosphatase [Planctomycetia bacterium]